MAWVFLRSCTNGAYRALLKLQSSFLIFANITGPAKVTGLPEVSPTKEGKRAWKWKPDKGIAGIRNRGKRAIVRLSCSVSKEILRQIMALGVFFLKGLKQGESEREMLRQNILTQRTPNLVWRKASGKTISSSFPLLLNILRKRLLHNYWPVCVERKAGVMFTTYLASSGVNNEVSILILEVVVFFCFFVFLKAPFPLSPSAAPHQTMSPSDVADIWQWLCLFDVALDLRQNTFLV